MRYSGCLIAVCDMAASRRFYEDKQTPERSAVRGFVLQ